MASRFLQSAAFLLGLLAQATAQSGPRPDPFVDPKNDPYNPLRYIASNSLTAVGFSFILVVAILQTWCMKRWGAKWMAAMTVGAYCMALGLSFRFALAKNPQSMIIYILESLFVLLSPCGFIAAEYVLLGRLAGHLDAGHHLFISPRRITIIFVSSDILTFLIQGGGGGISAGADTDARRKLGANMVLVGLVAQLCSFLLFSALYLRFLYRVRKYEPKIWKRDEDKVWGNRWTTLAVAFGVSCVGILVRSAFRMIEMTQGYGGPLTTTEFWFYALDTLPLFIAIALYVPFWPGRFISPVEPNVQRSGTIQLAERQA